MFEIQLPINPVPASRPRVTRAGISYYAEPYKSFKRDAKELLKERWTQPLIDYPVVVSIVVLVARPKTTKLSTPKPDWDNYAKGVCDAMNETVVTDDSLITKGSCEKMWAAKGEPGRIHIYIEKKN